MFTSRTTQTAPDDELFAGDYPVVTKPETLVSGQNLARGAVVGRITASGKLTLSAAAANDGSQVPIGVLADAVDASAGDKACRLYGSGYFAADQLTYGAGHTAATVAKAWDLAPLFLRAPVVLN